MFWFSYIYALYFSKMAANQTLCAPGSLVVTLTLVTTTTLDALPYTSFSFSTIPPFPFPSSLRLVPAYSNPTIKAPVPAALQCATEASIMLAGDKHGRTITGLVSEKGRQRINFLLTCSRHDTSGTYSFGAKIAVIEWQTLLLFIYSCS